MNRYKRILAGLNLEETDPAVIRYAGLITRMANSEALICMHAAPTLEIPESVEQEYPELITPLSEFAEKKMGETVDQHLAAHPGTEIQCLALEGKTLLTLLRQIKDQDIDLVLVGKRDDDGGDGTLARRLARKASCSVLEVPQSAPAKISKILVPIDFSEYSADALDVAVAFASASGLKEIFCLHVYRVPLGYYKTGKNYEQFSDIMKKNAEQEYRQFIKKVDLKNLNVRMQFILEKEPETAIDQTVEQYGADLIVLGSRGRSASAAVLLGSVTENLLKRTRIPLLAVKKKGTGLNFLNALLGG